MKCVCAQTTYLLTYAHCSQWSIGHQRPPSIALCSGLLLSFQTSWSPAVSALLQCLASNCCEAGLSCAQTRPRFILSSERVFGGMEFEPMLTQREKSPLPENFPRGGSNPRRCGQRAQTLPTSYSSPPFSYNQSNIDCGEKVTLTMTESPRLPNFVSPRYDLSSTAPSVVYRFYDYFVHRFYDHS